MASYSHYSYYEYYTQPVSRSGIPLSKFLGTCVILPKLIYNHLSISLVVEEINYHDESNYGSSEPTSPSIQNSTAYFTARVTIDNVFYPVHKFFNMILLHIFFTIVFIISIIFLMLFSFLLEFTKQLCG